MQYTKEVPAILKDWIITPTEEVNTERCTGIVIMFKYENPYSELDKIYEETKRTGKVFNTHKEFMSDLLS